MIQLLELKAWDTPVEAVIISAYLQNLFLVPDTLQTSNFIRQLIQIMCLCPYLYTQFLPQIVFC